MVDRSFGWRCHHCCPGDVGVEQKTCSGSTLSRLVLIVKVIFPGMAHPWTSFILNGAIEDSSLKTAISLSVVLPSPVMSQRKLQKNFRIGRTPGTPDTSGSVTLRHSKGNQPWRWHPSCSSYRWLLPLCSHLCSVLEIEAMASHMLGKRSTSWATSPTLLIFYFEAGSPKLSRLVLPQFVTQTSFQLAILPQPPSILPSVFVILNSVLR